MVTAAIIFQLSTWIYSDEFRWIYNSSKESYNFRKYWKNYFCSSSAEDLVPSKETPNSNASLHVSFSEMGDNQWSFSQMYFEDDVAEMNQNVPVRSKTCLILKEIVRSFWR